LISDDGLRRCRDWLGVDGEAVLEKIEFPFLLLVARHIFSASSQAPHSNKSKVSFSMIP